MIETIESNRRSIKEVVASLTPLRQTPIYQIDSREVWANHCRWSDKNPINQKSANLGSWYRSNQPGRKKKRKLFGDLELYQIVGIAWIVDGWHGWHGWLTNHSPRGQHCIRKTFFFRLHQTSNLKEDTFYIYCSPRVDVPLILQVCRLDLIDGLPAYTYIGICDAIYMFASLHIIITERDVFDDFLLHLRVYCARKVPLES